MVHKISQMTEKAMDTKNRDRENIGHRKRQVRDLPVPTQYAVEQGKERLKRPIKDFKEGMSQAKEKRDQASKQRSVAHRQTIAQKRMEMERKRQAAPTSQKTDKQNRLPTYGKTNTKQTEPKQLFVKRQQQPIPEKKNQAHQQTRSTFSKRDFEQKHQQPPKQNPEPRKNTRNRSTVKRPLRSRKGKRL